MKEKERLNKVQQCLLNEFYKEGILKKVNQYKNISNINIEIVQKINAILQKIKL